jgi:hypothetical protein
MFEHTGVLLLLLEELVDLVADLTLRNLDIVLGLAALSHQRHEAILSNIELSNISSARFLASRSAGCTHELVFLAADIRNLHIVGRRRQIFQLLAGEQVQSDQMDLGVTVLAGLGSGHVDDLAWALLDHDEAVLAQSGTLHRVGEGRAGIGGLEGELMLLKSDSQYGVRDDAPDSSEPSLAGSV